MSTRPSSYWRLRPYLYRLEGNRCTQCGHFNPLARKICRKCGSRRLERDRLAGRGKLRHFTVVYQPQTGFEKTVPYVVAWVEMSDGTQIIGQVTDCEPSELSVGMDVETVVRKIRVDGESKLIVYGVKFRPVL